MTDEKVYGLSPQRQGVIVEMIFQLGMSGVRGFRRMWDALRNNDYNEAGAEMIDSAWAQQTPTRAQTLAEIMKTGEDQ
jgi:lysozyme